MIAKLTRFAALVLTTLVVLIGGLYAFANAEWMLAAAQAWLAPAVLAAETPPTLPPDQPAETAGGAAGGSAENAASAQTAPVQDLPPFALANMLALAPPDSDQIVYILAEGSEGNLWLAERRDGVWYNAMGPVYCRVAQDGLRWGRTEGAAVTPSGWAKLGALYATQPVQTGWPSHEVSKSYQLPGPDPASEAEASAGDSPGPDPASEAEASAGDSPASAQPWLPGSLNLVLGFDAGSLFLYGSDDLTVPTQGSVALAPADITRLIGLLDSRAGTRVGIFSAASAGWKIDTGVPEDFVSLAQAVPGIRIEPRYAGDNNFMGRPLDGYQGLHIYLRVEAAAALAEAAAVLAEQGLGLLVYDGYRPIRAVDDIFSWLASDTPGNQGDFYPELDKDDLPGVYLAENSPHRQGIAVDLTVCDLETGQPLDMGTPFDFFSARSWVNSGELSETQRANRKLLRQTMIDAGFESYSREWWHFNYRGYVPQKTARDFVIPQ